MPKSKCQDLFFLTTNSARYTQVYQKIKEAIKSNDIDVDLPAPGAFRIKVTSELLKKVTKDVTRRKINKHLSHSDQTAEQFYEYLDDGDAIKAYNEMRQLEDI